MRDNSIKVREHTNENVAEKISNKHDIIEKELIESKTLVQYLRTYVERVHLEY